MNKSIQMSSVAYAMLIELSKKQRIKPEYFVDQLIRKEYEKKK